MNKQYIQELIIKEHYGLLTADEREELDLLLEHYEEVRTMREDVRREVPVAEAQDAIRLFDLDQSYENIMARHAANKAAGRKRWFRHVAAVCLLLMLAGSAWYLAGTRRQAPAAPVIAANDDAVVLKLAGGETVTLGDSGTHQINVQNTVLNSDNKQLSVKTGAGGTGTGWNTLSVPAGKTYEVELNDGTLVWLNSASKIRFPFSFQNGFREVYIEGEAYFRVAPDENRPFIVYSGVTVVKVLGTEFNINAYLPGRIITSLVNGKVTVHAEGEQAELTPGQEAITRTGTPIHIQESPALAAGWRQGVYYFENSSIAEITAVLERCFAIRVVMDNSQVRSKTFRGKLLRENGLQAFMTQMNETRQVKFYWQNGILHCR